ncbi:MAG: hypothetical protein JNM13_05170 [Hyphomicrobiaceae bacterium]|nr:hypothetical protein [Hyphomicrobiaceae bacterium]
MTELPPDGGSATILTKSVRMQMAQAVATFFDNARYGDDLLKVSSGNGAIADG